VLGVHPRRVPRAPVGPDQLITVFGCHDGLGTTVLWKGARCVTAAARLVSQCGHAERRKHLCQAPAPQSLKFQPAGPATTARRRHRPLEKRRAYKAQTADANFAYLEGVANANVSGGRRTAPRVHGAGWVAWWRWRQGRASSHNGRAGCSAARSGEEGGRADTQVTSWVMDRPPRKSTADV